MDTFVDPVKKLQFLNLYNEIINKQGKVKLCGRDKCIELIRRARAVDSSKAYGDLYTGFLDMHSLRNLFERIS